MKPILSFVARTAAVAGLVSMVAFGAATTSSANSPSPYYEYRYYSDASMTEQVGFIREWCINGSVIMNYEPDVVFTEHYTQTQIGYCPGPGDWS